MAVVGDELSTGKGGADKIHCYYGSSGDWKKRGNQGLAMYMFI